MSSGGSRFIITIDGNREIDLTLFLAVPYVALAVGHMASIEWLTGFGVFGVSLISLFMAFLAGMFFEASLRGEAVVSTISSESSRLRSVMTTAVPVVVHLLAIGTMYQTGWDEGWAISSLGTAVFLVCAIGIRWTRRP